MPGVYTPKWVENFFQKYLFWDIPIFKNKSIIYYKKSGNQSKKKRKISLDFVAKILYNIFKKSGNKS